MARTEVWTRSVPESVKVGDGSLSVVETETEVEITISRRGRVVVDVDDMRLFLAEAGYERATDG